MHEQIVVTGLGCIGSLGHTPGEFVDRLLEGRTAVGPVQAFDTSGCRAHTACTVGDFDAAAYLDPVKLRRVDRIGQFALAACRLALDDARLRARDAAGGDNVGIVLGSYTAGCRSAVGYLGSLFKQGALGASALSFSNTVGNAAASLCALEFRLRGPNVTVSNKEASSLAAIATAVEFLEEGRARAVVTGGVDDLEVVFYTSHDRFRALAHGDDGGASRPFDRRRNGFVFGEGAFLLVLEPASAAARRGGRGHGSIVATSATASNGGLNAWPREPADLARCMRLALEAAGVEPPQVQFVMASANSTELDRTEAAAIAEVFGLMGVPVAAIKGAIGEFGASGAASVMVALEALHRRTIPPTVGCDQLDGDLRVDVAPVARPLPARADGGLALVNSFASGGTHYCALVGGLPAS